MVPQGNMRSAISASRVRLKPVRDPAIPADGTRVLVDRLWPRGVRKADAAIDVWCQDLAPSAGLRQWFGHEPARWTEFRHRYAAQVRAHPAQLSALRMLARQGPVTLVFGAHERRYNNAVALRGFILGRWPRTAKKSGKR